MLMQGKRFLTTIKLEEEVLKRVRKDADRLGWATGTFLEAFIEFALKDTKKVKPPESRDADSKGFTITLAPSTVRDLTAFVKARNWRGPSFAVRALLEARLGDFEKSQKLL